MLGRKTETLLDDSELFDETKGYDDETGIRFATGLTPEEQKQAVSLYRLFNGLWGVCLSYGDPGIGKDVWGNYITYKLKKFFPQKRTLRDERPRRLFGRYDGLFNPDVIQADLAKMRAIAKGVKVADLDGVLEKAADDWVRGAGQVMLKNSVLYLTEYWRYCYKREPHNPMNKTMGAIQKVKRHLDLLIIGTTQLIEDLDRFTALPWIDWRVTCIKSKSRPHCFTNLVQRVKYDKRLEVLVPLGSPFPISFDAGKPRSNMGDGKITVTKHQYKPANDTEKIVLDYLHNDIGNYEQLVAELDEKGLMEEDEVLDTIKELSFNPRKRVIGFPCYYRIFNSKSAPQLQSSLKIEE